MRSEFMDLGTKSNARVKELIILDTLYKSDQTELKVKLGLNLQIILEIY